MESEGTDSADFFRIVDLTHVRNFDRPIIFLFGGPGAGKATLSYHLRAKYGISYINIGALLREEAGEPTARGRAIAKFVHQLPCQKVHTDLAMDVLKDALVRAVAAKRPILIQGFPRDLEQANRYEDEIGPIRHAFYLNTTFETATKRLSTRNRLAGRFEDQSESIQRRMKLFEDEVVPVIDNLARANRVIEINGNGSPTETLFEAQQAYQYWVGGTRTWTVREPAANTRNSDEDLTRSLTKKELEAEKKSPSVHRYLYKGV